MRDDGITSDVECCGIAGSFGYKSQNFDVAVAVGDDLRDHFTTDAAVVRRVVASGTSCMEQLDALRERPVTHPVELLDAGTGGATG